MKRLLRLAAWLACLVSFPAVSQYYGPGYGEDTYNYTALWYLPSESGWGMNTNHQDNTIFMTLFTYAADGQPMWLVGPSLGLQNQYTYTGKIYRTSGPPFNQTPWTAITPQEVGTMSIYFVGANQASVTYTFNGVSVTKSVQRQEFSQPVPECMAVSGSRKSMRNYQDLWYNASESGWGINITHQGDIIFATWFTYGTGGKGLWIVGSNMSKTDNGVYSGVLQTTTGPNPFSNTVPFDPLKVTRTTVGDATFTFSDANNGTFRYTVNGITQTKNITRLVFAAGPVTVCK